MMAVFDSGTNSQANVNTRLIKTLAVVVFEINVNKVSRQPVEKCLIVYIKPCV